MGSVGTRRLKGECDLFVSCDDPILKSFVVANSDSVKNGVKDWLGIFWPECLLERAPFRREKIPYDQALFAIYLASSPWYFSNAAGNPHD